MKSMCVLAAGLLLASPMTGFGQDWYTKAVKSVDLTVSPAEAKPGQTVTVLLTLELNEKYHTYPLTQPDSKAADMVNSITFPEADLKGLIFVGKAKDPKNPIKKAEPLLGIKEFHTFEGIVTYERPAVVSPKASGTVSVSIPKFVIQVCDETNCFPVKTLNPACKLNVAGPAVEISKEYKSDVEKALSGKK
ncbi:MAG: hypothetical protein U0798_20310 [Gemmataceae bacterium]